jgi:hypothetical protein
MTQYSLGGSLCCFGLLSLAWFNYVRQLDCHHSTQ